jgi:RNA polymerase sigma-70 factor (ECF subfamily)
MVRNRIDARMRQRLDPSDVVQDALLCACRRLTDFLHQDHLPFYVWLQRITEERLISLHRWHIVAQKRAVNRERWLDTSQPPDSCSARRVTAAPVDASGSPSTSGSVTRIRCLLALLPDEDREILLMRHRDGLTNAQRAAVLGLSPEALKKRYLRALWRVRDLAERQAAQRP